ncbi:MAG: hypothetical protein RJA99_4606 [Pseudomonadota bacterium]|jgi:hypothetical protein
MFRRRFRRLTTTLALVASLLVSQWAMATYVCPVEAPAEAAMQAMLERMAAGEPCHGMDEAQPAMCHQHVMGSPESLEASGFPPLTLPAVIQLIVLPTLVSEPGSHPSATAPLLRPWPPPTSVFLSTRRLRV